MSVMVTGVGKSGNNLLLKLCKLLGFQISKRGLGAHNFQGKYALAKRLVAANLVSDPISLGLAQPWSARESWLRGRFAGSRGMVMGAHSAYSSRFVDILESEGYVALAITRDPRDVLVSYAHWISTRPDIAAYDDHRDISFDERVKLLLRGNVSGKVKVDSFPTILDRAFGWTQDPRVTSVRFEDLVASAPRETQLENIALVAKAIGRERNDYSDIQSQLFGGTGTFRMGKAGTWKQELSDDMQQEVERSIGIARFTQWGYAS